MKNDKYPRLANQRVALLIDIANLYHGCMNNEGKRADFRKLIDTLVGNRDLVKAIAFLKRREGDEQFVKLLKTIGYSIFTPTKDNGDIDVQLAVKAIAISNSVDTIILVTGDADFISVCNYLRAKGTRVEIAGYLSSVNHRLLNIVDDFQNLNERNITI